MAAATWPHTAIITSGHNTPAATLGLNEVLPKLLFGQGQDEHGGCGGLVPRALGLCCQFEQLYIRVAAKIFALGSLRPTRGLAVFFTRVGAFQTVAISAPPPPSVPVFSIFNSRFPRPLFPTLDTGKMFLQGACPLPSPSATPLLPYTYVDSVCFAPYQACR